MVVSYDEVIVGRVNNVDITEERNSKLFNNTK